MAENGSSAEPLVWLWRAFISALLVFILGVLQKGCEFRDDTLGRLTIMERDYFHMHEVDVEQTLQMRAMDAMLNGRLDEAFRQVRDLEDRLTEAPPLKAPRH